MTDPAPTVAAPSVGRIVHHVSADQTCHAAVVTEIGEQLDADLGAFIRLAVFDPANGLIFHNPVYADHETRQPGTWHWPEIV